MTTGATGVSFAANGLVVFQFRTSLRVGQPNVAGGWLGRGGEYDQILVIAREFAASLPAVNSTWDHMLPLSPAAARLARFRGLVLPRQRCCFGHLLGLPLLGVHVGVWDHASADIWRRPASCDVCSVVALPLNGLWLTSRTLADWARFVKLTVLLQGGSLVRRAPGDAALRS